jgi:antiviral helicase SKI2
LDGVFAELTPPQLVAFLTCLYVEEDHKRGHSKHVERPPADPKLAKAWAALGATARKVAAVQNECGLTTDADEYVALFSCELVDVTLCWCQVEPLCHLVKRNQAFLKHAPMLASLDRSRISV